MRIKEPQYAKQLIDFSGLKLDDDVYPTDIDALIEYKDSKYLIFEIKYKRKQIPKGQRLALQRMADDFFKAGKEAIVIICEHNIKDTSQPVVAADCRVREIYHDAGWWKPKDKPLVGYILQEIQDYPELWWRKQVK